MPVDLALEQLHLLRNPDRAFDDVARHWQEHAPGIGDLKAASPPLEQVHAQLHLQGLDMLADARLGQVQAFGRLGEIQGFSGDHKDIQLVYIQHGQKLPAIWTFMDNFILLEKLYKKGVIS